MNRNERDLKTTAELLKLATDKAAHLERERTARPGNNHPDSRVPGEIVEVLAFIGCRKRELVNIIKANRLAIVKHEANIEEIDRIAVDLKFELDIATGFRVIE
jgi:hypothetical protein